MNNIRETLEEFAYNLASLSPDRIENFIKIVLPSELYRQFVREISDVIHYSSCILSPNITGAIKYSTVSGVNFIVTCKEVDREYTRKLANTFINSITNDIY